VKQCDFGGHYDEFLDGRPPRHVPQCKEPAVVQYWTPGMSREYPGYRCEGHAECLSAPGIEIERLGATP
jgi:hypothetical protein